MDRKPQESQPNENRNRGIKTILFIFTGETFCFGLLVEYEYDSGEGTRKREYGK
jgi:hypothetical protein